MTDGSQASTEDVSGAATDSGCCAPQGSAPVVFVRREGGVSRDDVRDFYGRAATAPSPDLCCPTGYADADIAHIPEEVLSVSYGCGSPMALAAPRAGEVVVDLGCGGGVDCFIAARMVGREGRVVGVDMTDEMLATATRNAAAVADRLGYANVSFEKGFLEDVPVADGAVDLLTSNCVLNLSTDKAAVFKEIYRVLRQGGRFVIADIVADRQVPEEILRDRALWGGCIAGAMTERRFAALAEAAGFYGVTLERGALWREVAGVRFYSTTFTGWRRDKASPCLYSGRHATYLGPARSVTDDEGHEFLRGEAVEVCDDTAARLTRPPYAGMFHVEDPSGPARPCC